MEKPEHESIEDLPRNDVEAAIATMRWMRKQGTWDDAYNQALLRLQDNPETLKARLIELES